MNYEYYKDVHEPDHYTAGDIETIDYIRDKLTPSQFLGYCIGNVLKYVSRYDKKGEPAKDLDKAMVYLGWAQDAVKEDADEPGSQLEKVVEAWNKAPTWGFDVNPDFAKDIEVAIAKSVVGGPGEFSADDWYHEEFGDDSQD